MFGVYIRGVRPDHGGRLEFRLESAAEAQATYQLAVFAPEGEWQTRVSVQTGNGEVAFADWSSPPPEWLEDVARALLRTLWRNHKSGTPWPRRITRWRNEPT